MLEAASKAGITINSACGGDGICGRCKMRVLEGKVSGPSASLLSSQEIEVGIVLACQTRPASDLVIEIPSATKTSTHMELDKEAQRFRAIDSGITEKEFTRSPLVDKIPLNLDPPTLENNLADCQRIQDKIEKTSSYRNLHADLSILRIIPRILRQNNFALTATICRHVKDNAEIINVESGDTSNRNYMIIVDVGTSTVVAHLLDTAAMRTIDAQACFNSQAVYGREVTARIMAAEKKGVHVFQEKIVEDINNLISTLTRRNNIDIHDVYAAVCAGNTIMMHFLLGLHVENIRREPYISTTLDFPAVNAAEIGIKINQNGFVFCIPCISSWVGGDLTSGILATDLHERDKTAMLIDIGTNGEIIIGNKEWLMACSASTGPALEGASVNCGMTAEKGAIEKVYIEKNKILYRTIGNTAPAGICGSGIIDLIAVLLDMKIINRSGKFVPKSHPDLSFENGLGMFKLADNIFITQDDIDNIMTAKAAVFAAINIMLDKLNLNIGDIDKLFLAGGFGSYVNIINAIKIGLIPDIPLSNIQYAGNTSVWGAKLAALSLDAYSSLHDICARTTYYDLMGSKDYVEQFQQAMFLPHTNIELFPSIKSNNGRKE